MRDGGREEKNRRFPILYLNFRHFLEICRDALLKEEYEEADIDREMAIITVQLGYVYQLQGKVTEALQLYYGILKSRAGDKAIAAVTSNNVIAAKGETELFDSMRRYKIASAPGLESKLTTSQRTVIALNGAILSLYRKKVILKVYGDEYM